LQGLQGRITPGLARSQCCSFYLRLPRHVRVYGLCGCDVGCDYLAWFALLFFPHLAQGAQQLGWVLADEGRDVLQRVTAEWVKPFAPIVLHQREFELVCVLEPRLLKQVVAL